MHASVRHGVCQEGSRAVQGSCEGVAAPQLQLDPPLQSATACHLLIKEDFLALRDSSSGSSLLWLHDLYLEVFPRPTPRPDVMHTSGYTPCTRIRQQHSMRRRWQHGAGSTAHLCCCPPARSRMPLWSCTTKAGTRARMVVCATWIYPGGPAPQPGSCLRMPGRSIRVCGPWQHLCRPEAGACRQHGPGRVVAEEACDLQVDRRQARPESQVSMLFQTRSTDIWATQCVFRGDNVNSRFLEAGPNRRLYLRGAPLSPTSSSSTRASLLVVGSVLDRARAHVRPGSQIAATPIQHAPGGQAKSPERSQADFRFFRVCGC